MRLGARILRAVCGANNYEYADEFSHNELSANTLYVQLVNLEHNPDGDPDGIPYHPMAGSMLDMTFPSIDSNKVTVKNATQPFSENSSIWSASITATDEFGPGNLVMTLTEGGVVKRITVINGIVINPVDPSRC